MAQRGRKKGSDGEASRALLLRIAADEFAEHGYHDTKISTIVRKANVTQPTFYLYFKSKEAIFEELEDLFRTKLAHLTMGSLVDEKFDDYTAFRRMEERLTKVLQFFMDHRSLARIGFCISPSAAEVKTQMAEHIEAQLREKSTAEHLYPNVDVGIVASGLVGMIERLALTKLWTGEKTAPELANNIVTVLLYGLQRNTRVSSIE
ncbi:TetR/AcrR family transcriptional regulator [Domibacillus sp. DTU_2020_1001157_1_SI_ALB_TIR_016]|uniref:TetR/AcrR family transcriptional regulator n=1 Tax=Domibacillus sp. DTU_2020_1001157_1_SI_ALB_TIR_016 TaxID=3077789 RepID=UPI0028E7F4ED|nr:TetR/AcrR family transcriptional regulator [Domibacillus sp. DTU_2020_1001157_1_SI_ALB_TIR_016]WNS81172.1 TetR/AcrR family transcriptional regulator [Domibacillus sp. DTU_2020_1001157_1_SI_ALB_TIR_016]